MHEGYLLAAVRYVELNRVSAGFAKEPWSYTWSSAHAHLTGVDDNLVKVAPFLKLLKTGAVFIYPAYQKKRWKNCASMNAPEDLWEMSDSSTSLRAHWGVLSLVDRRQVGKLAMSRIKYGCPQNSEFPLILPSPFQRKQGNAFFKCHQFIFLRHVYIKGISGIPVQEVVVIPVKKSLKN